MNNKTLGFLIGAVVGALAWLYRKKLVDVGVKEVPVVLKHRKDGACGVEKVRDVTLRRTVREPVKWLITNPEHGGCGRRVVVRLDAWRRGDEPSAPPVTPEHSFEREVKPGQTKVIPARANRDMADGDYSYDIFIDGERALDPIVKLVL